MHHNIILIFIFINILPFTNRPGDGWGGYSWVGRFVGDGGDKRRGEMNSENGNVMARAGGFSCSWGVSCLAG